MENWLFLIVLGLKNSFLKKRITIWKCDHGWKTPSYPEVWRVLHDSFLWKMETNAVEYLSQIEENALANWIRDYYVLNFPEKYWIFPRFQKQSTGFFWISEQKHSILNTA